MRMRWMLPSKNLGLVFLNTEQRFGWTVADWTAAGQHKTIIKPDQGSKCLIIERKLEFEWWWMISESQFRLSIFYFYEYPQRSRRIIPHSPLAADRWWAPPGVNHSLAIVIFCCFELCRCLFPSGIFRDVTLLIHRAVPLFFSLKFLGFKLAGTMRQR